MYPKHVETSLPQTRQQSVVHRPPPPDTVGLPNGGKELMRIAAKKRNIPFHGLAETRILVAADRQIALKENCQLDIGESGDPPQESRLILDRMGDEISEPYRRRWALSSWRCNNGILVH